MCLPFFAQLLGDVEVKPRKISIYSISNIRNQVFYFSYIFVVARILRDNLFNINGSERLLVVLVLLMEEMMRIFNQVGLVQLQ